MFGLSSWIDGFPKKLLIYDGYYGIFETFKVLAVL